ncbi:hypothetical protein YC2023_064404 [Brassica napus]
MQTSTPYLEDNDLINKSRSDEVEQVVAYVDKTDATEDQRIREPMWVDKDTNKLKDAFVLSEHTTTSLFMEMPPQIFVDFGSSDDGIHFTAKSSRIVVKEIIEALKVVREADWQPSLHWKPLLHHLVRPRLKKTLAFRDNRASTLTIDCVLYQFHPLFAFGYSYC